MGDITIRFRMNVETGKKDIVVEYDADDDALPHEHEKRHKEIVERLLGEGILQPGEAVSVERIKPAPAQARETKGREGEAAAQSG